MARFTKKDKDDLVQRAEKMFLDGFDHNTIADLIGVTVSTVEKWSRDGDFETKRKRRLISLSEIRNTILETFAELKDGKEPKIKPDDISKIAKAFETFSDKKKVLAYMYEAFERLEQDTIMMIQKSKLKKDKQEWFDFLQKQRTIMDITIANLNKEVFDND